jgi:predicted transcriptional regulator
VSGVFTGKNRDRLSIIAAILETAKTGASKTRIMFMANLSFNLLEKYLDVVLHAGFIQVSGSHYTLTKDGDAFLKQYGDYHERYLKAQALLETLGCERDKLTLMCQKSNQNQ